MITHHEQSEYGRPPCSAGYVAKALIQMILGRQITLRQAIVQVSFVERIAAVMRPEAIEARHDPPTGILGGGVKP